MTKMGATPLQLVIILNAFLLMSATLRLGSTVSDLFKKTFLLKNYWKLSWFY